MEGLSWGFRRVGGRTVGWSLAVSALIVAAGCLPAAGVARSSNGDPMVGVVPHAGQAARGIRVMWGRRIAYEPRPQPGKRVRITLNAVILETGGGVTREVLRPVGVKVRVRGGVCARVEGIVKRMQVGGAWRSDVDEYGGDGQVRCGPWMVLKDSLGLSQRVTPRLVYSGTTLRGPTMADADLSPFESCSTGCRRCRSPSCHASRAARSTRGSPMFRFHRRSARYGARSANRLDRPAARQRWARVQLEDLSRRTERRDGGYAGQDGIPGGALRFRIGGPLDEGPVAFEASRVDDTGRNSSRFHCSACQTDSRPPSMRFAQLRHRSPAAAASRRRRTVSLLRAVPLSTADPRSPHRA